MHLWAKGPKLAYPQEMRAGRQASPTVVKGGELALIRRIRTRAAQTAPAGVRLGIGDDCALLRVRRGEEMAVTTDLSIDGRHFRLDWHPPESVGHRTLARGLSDLAAMGARPVAAFLSLGLPRELASLARGDLARSSRTQPKIRSGTELKTGSQASIGQASTGQAWMDRYLDGLLSLAESYKTPLAGGDLAESPIAVADIVLIGAVKRGKALLRSGASPGDLLYVTGGLGGAAVGIKRLGQLTEPRHAGRTGHAFVQPPRIPRKWEAALAPHLYPQPRVAQGLWLARRGWATAAIDLSDGLSTDLRHLCEESGVSAEIDAARLPIHPGADLAQALHGGEDYELLFTASPSARVPRSIGGVAVTCIGHIGRLRAGRPHVVLAGERSKQPLEAQGWEHFS